MKTLKIACTALILLAGTFAAACSSDTETEAADRVEIDGLDEGVHFPYDPEEGVSFSISANKTWSISKSGLDWLTVSQMNGGSKLPATITLTAAPNDDLERSGELTVYAGAHVQRVTVTQDAFPIVPTLTLDGLTDDTLEFEFSDLDPVTFSVYANVAWTALPEELDWAEVSPLSGERKKRTTITVTPSANGGDARQGTITFRAEEMEPVVVTVRQTAYRDDPLLTVTGFGKNNTIEFPEVPEAPAALQILCNRSWTVVKEGLDWLTVTPESGTSSPTPADITLTASKNTGKARTGTLTIHPDDPALEDVVITVSQKAKSLEPIAWWTLTDEALKKYSGDNWLTGGRMFADKPAGTTVQRRCCRGDRRSSERRKIDAAEPPAQRGTRDGLGNRRHDARRDRGAGQHRRHPFPVPRHGGHPLDRRPAGTHGHRTHDGEHPAGAARHPPD